MATYVLGRPRDVFSVSSNQARPKAHFIGIGGTGMVAGARLAVEAGWEIRGSDGPLYPPASDMAAALGVPITQSYAASNLDWGPDLVVIGNALSRGNPEVEAVLERRLHYVSLPEWLKDAVLRARRPIVITGTHGKTTTTALTAFVLDAAGAAPGYLIGGDVKDFPHSARLGAPGAPFVIEGDEYDTAFFDKRAKFFHYLPEIAVVTSLEFDHGDIYPAIEDIERAFRLMLRQIPISGHLLLCTDFPRAAALREHAPCQVHTYGRGAEADYRVEITSNAASASTFILHHRGESLGPCTTALPGEYNSVNAAAAIITARLAGVDPQTVIVALPRFQGVKRRMDVFHQSGGIVFIDDFAHHPTAIRETVTAALARYAGHRLIACFEPRSNTTVTNRFQHDIAEAFRGAAQVWFGPVHRAEKIQESERLDRGALARRIGPQAAYTDDVAEIVSWLRDNARPGDVVLCMSNGAFGGIYQKIRETFA